MTTDAAYSGDDPRQMLSGARDLVRQVRKTQRATWFPLLVFAAVTFAAIPMSRIGRSHLGTCVSTGHLHTACTVYSYVGFGYWPIALVLAYAAIAAFYIRRSRASGVGTRVRPYAIAGTVVGLATTGAVLWGLYHPPGTVDALPSVPAPFPFMLPGVKYSCSIGLALLVLAWAERSRALLALTIGYLAVVLAPISFGWDNGQFRWGFLPQLVFGGSVLLLGGIGFALVQRPWRRAP
jgi:hypothetical protein